MSEPPNKPARQPKPRRRPNLEAGLRAVKRAGLESKLKSVAQDGDRLVFSFANGGEVIGDAETDWNEGIKKWKELGRGKRKT